MATKVAWGAGVRAWQCMAYGADRVYGGNQGYADEVHRCYRYDDFVPNHKQLEVGDFLVILGRERVLGYAKIQRIESTPGNKTHLRCPVCRTTGIKVRRSKAPAYRCNSGHEFHDPISEVVPCVQFAAHYEQTFVPEPLVVTREQLRPAWIIQGDQAAMRKIDFAKLLDVLSPATRVVVKAVAGALLGALQFLKADDAAEDDDHYSPGESDERDLVGRQVRERRGQAKFRNALRARYGDRCQISGLGMVELLEAAHIRPYRGESDNHPENGLLLRTDLHTLFDLDLLGVNPSNLRVGLHPVVLAHQEFRDIEGREISCRGGQPSEQALVLRWDAFHQRLQTA